MNINWVAVVIATLAFFMLGGIWFTVIFSKAYAFALGKENAPKEKPALFFLLGPLVGDFVTVIALDILIYAFHIQSISDAIIYIIRPWTEMWRVFFYPKGL
ncbi:MAG: DUF1761 domain-containing protein [Clostridiaceae bacterium]|nr:DUF1761 domain-containing protein [Clostridiaceae bacterium]